MLTKLCYKSVFPVLLIVSILGCNESGPSRNRGINNIKLQAKGKREKGNVNILVKELCLDINIDSIRNHPIVYLRQDESCVIELINKLSDMYKAIQDEEILQCYERLCEVSDGYVSEYLCATFFNIFETQTYQFITCLNRGYERIIWMLVAEFNLSDISTVKIRKILDSSNLSSREKVKFLEKVDKITKEF